MWLWHFHHPAVCTLQIQASTILFHSFSVGSSMQLWNFGNMFLCFCCCCNINYCETNTKIPFDRSATVLVWSSNVSQKIKRNWKMWFVFVTKLHITLWQMNDKIGFYMIAFTTLEFRFFYCKWTDSVLRANSYLQQNSFCFNPSFPLTTLLIWFVSNKV